MPVKLAYWVDTRMPTEKANGYQSAQMCQGFVETGMTVTLLFPARIRNYSEGIGPDTILERYYHLRAPLPTKRIPCLDFIYLLQNILRLSDGNPITQLGSLLTSRSAAFAFSWHLRSNPYDVIYIRSLHGLIALGALLSPQKMRSVCMELHILPKRRRTLRALVKALHKIGGIVTVTGHLRQQLVDLGIPNGKISVQPDGVDLPTFDINSDQNEARKKLGFPENRLLASFVGKFHTMGQEKGIPEILASAKHLIHEFPHLYFLFVGGPLDRVPRYQEEIRTAGLPTDRFIFLGKQPVELVPWFLKASDVLLMPHPWSEFFAYHVSPLKLFEYMSAKKPIVASRLPAIMEILEDGRNALLSEAGNAKDLAGNIRRALTQPELGKKISSNAYADAQNFTWALRSIRIAEFLKVRKGVGENENGGSGRPEPVSAIENDL